MEQKEVEDREPLYYECYLETDINKYVIKTDKNGYEVFLDYLENHLHEVEFEEIKYLESN